MERTLLNEIYAQWKSAKYLNKMECENRALFNIMNIVLNVQRDGRPRTNHPAVHFSARVEFCQKYHFPDITTLRRFKQYDVERYAGLH